MEIFYFIITIIVVLFIKSIYDKKRYRYMIVQSLKAGWGKASTDEYTTEHLRSIATYYESLRDENLDVDDITWNDLDMEELFMIMNNTCCSMGEEYLYSVLRKLQYDDSKLLKRNELIEYFEKNPEKALELQVILKGLGKIRKISIYEYMNHFSKVRRDSTLAHVGMAVGLIASLVLILFNPAIGGVLTVFFLCFNVVNYYKRKGEIDSYITVCSYIVRMLACIDDLKKIKIDELNDYFSKLETSRKKFSKFKRGSNLVTSKNATGDLADIILDYVRMLFHVDLIKFNSMLDCFNNNQDTLNEMFEIIGTMDSMVAIASFRTMMGQYSIPKLKSGKDYSIKVDDLYHPLIEEPVCNSIDVDGSVLITGSNASGKSTFLKSLAINAILSQTIYTSLSKSYEANYFKVMSSMALKDNIFSKESYYIVEIKSLKRIIDKIDPSIPTLCFVDEVLRGTNTLERIAASSQILYSFAKRNIICFAATHDIELTHILEKYYRNYHFQEQISDNNIIFDYQIYEGRAISRNAIKLLGIMGYEEAIIENATNNANEFLEKGMWSVME